MANFTVELLTPAEEDLAEAWLATPNPAEVVRADVMATEYLTTDPIGRGTPLSEGLYRLTVEPLIFYYEIDLDRRHVRVGTIRRVR